MDIRVDDATADSGTHSLPDNLSPLNVPRQEHRPSLTRTPELSSLARRQPEVKEKTERAEVKSPEHARPETATTVDDENFDTASSELYLSQENICEWHYNPLADDSLLNTVQDARDTHSLSKSATQPIPSRTSHAAHAEVKGPLPLPAELAGQQHVPLNQHVSVRIR